MATPRQGGGGLRGFMEAQGAPPAPPEARSAPRPKASTKQKKERRRLKDGREQMVIYLRPSAKKALKRLGVDLDRPVTEIVAAAVEAELRRRGVELDDEEDEI